MRIAHLLAITTIGLALGVGCAEQPGKKKDDDKSKDEKKDGKDAKKTEAKVDPPK